jgi:hypothetical protein
MTAVGVGHSVVIVQACVMMVLPIDVVEAQRDCAVSGREKTKLTHTSSQRGTGA